MKKILHLLLPLLASQSAYALEVGEIVRLDRSQIQCTEGRVIPRPRCGRNGYGYCDYGYGNDFSNATAKITAPVDGVSNLQATISTCGVLNSILESVGNPVPMEVIQVNTQKLPGGLVIRYLSLSVGISPRGQLVFQGNKQL